MKKKKRLFAILLAFCVTFTMMPLTGSGGVAHAEDGTAANAVVTRTTMLDLTSMDGKYIATNGMEKTVDFTKKSVTDSAEGWSWNTETKTLTLSGARIVVTKPTFVRSGIQAQPGKTTMGYYYGVKIPGGDVSVVLAEGTESVIQACDAASDDNENLGENEKPRTVLASFGIGNIDDRGSFTLSGNGKLTVKGGKVNNANEIAAGQRISTGIYLMSHIIVEGNAKLEASGSECVSTFGPAYSRGVSCSQMTITDNAQVTATGGNASAVQARESTGISVSRSLSVSGSARLEAHGATVETGENASSTVYSDSMGISAPDFTASENASVYTYGGMAKGQAGSSAGVYIEKSSGTAEISGNAFLHAEGSESDRSSYGVKGSLDGTATAQLTIAGDAYIEAIGKDIGDNEHYECRGISIKKIQINGGTVVARAEADPTKTKGHIEAIVSMPTYAEGLTPVVKAGTTETDAVKIESPDENTYAKRWVKIQINESNYAITAAPSVIDFGTVKTGYAQPAPKTVTITNTGNETVELSKAVLQENSNYTVSQLSENRIAPRRTAEITVQPKEGLAAGTYNENLTISGNNEVSASVELKFNVTKSGGSGSGGSYIPVQKPAILEGEGSHTTLSADGTKLTITAADGYEITDVLLNGVSKGSVTELSELKTGDKVEIKTAKKADDPPGDDASLSAVKRKVAQMQSYARSSKTPNKNIKVVLKIDEKTEASMEALQKLGYTIKYKFYRSTKKSSAYKAKITKKTGTYINTSGKKGVRYYYKARILVYDKNGKLIAQTKLKQCQYACRVR